MADSNVPTELYAHFKRLLDLDCGYVFVAFMREDHDGGAPRVEDRLSEAYRDDDVARGVGGCFGALFQRDVQIFCAHFVYIHCEIAFEPNALGRKQHGADKMLAVLVNAKDNVAMRWRHYDNRYEWLQLRATRKQLEAMLKFACSTRGERFSAAQRDAAVVRPGVEQATGWYCTKHVATLLRSLDCEMFHFNRTNSLTCDELHTLVKFCNHSPSAHLKKQPPIVMEKIFGRDNVGEVLYATTEAGASKSERE